MNLGCQDDLIPPAIGLESPPKNTFTLAGVVGIGRIHKIDTGVEGHVQDFRGIGLVGRAPKVHRSQAQGGNLDAGSTKGSVLHI